MITTCPLARLSAGKSREVALADVASSDRVQDRAPNRGAIFCYDRNHAVVICVANSLVAKHSLSDCVHLIERCSLRLSLKKRTLTRCVNGPAAPVMLRGIKPRTAQSCSRQIPK